MLYYSTNKQSPKVSFKEATIQGQAADKGLYFPENIPAIEQGFFKNIKGLTKEEIAFKVIRPYIGDSIPENELRSIVSETVNFDFPLVKIKDDVYSLELYHGPTLAFKDVGARFMSRCLGYFMRNSKQKVTVLVATSGDTGGAVADGFYNVEGVEVVILYPSGKVSNVQELQLTTLGNNITALEIAGSFDDCQALVKKAFTDKTLTEHLFLTSANSINVARWLPQQFYYFFAYQQWDLTDAPPIIAVPSGNFGNICAGILAHRSGLPVKHFIAACNSNDVIPAYLDSGFYQAQPSVSTISNAMDVGDPSNFVRILEIFDHHLDPLKNMLSSYSISDEQTKATLMHIYQKYHYLADTHGAVGFAALEEYLQNHPGDKGIVLETAHPIKFFDVVEPIIHEKIPVPEKIKGLLEKEKKSIRMEANFDQLKQYLMR